MALYDINGNIIASGGSGSISGKVGLANLSEEIINQVMVIDENTEIINLLDISKVVTGRYDSTNAFNQYYSAYRTSDYIPIKAGYTYVAQSWDSSGGTFADRVVLFDKNKNFIRNYNTDGNGTIRYAIFTPEVNGYIRYAYTYSETAKPMVFIGLSTIDTFVEYTGETLDGEYYYQVANEFKKMIQRDVEPSNIFGKTVYIIGDSNADNWAGGASEHLEKRYGCKVIGLAKYGATWESSAGVNDTATSNAVGQWNAFIAEVGIDEETYTVPDDVVLVFMMGTNCGNKGTLAENIKDTSKDVSTAIGAENYILQLARYYCRNTSIGVVLPWCGATNAELKALCDYYKIPTFDLPSILCEDEPTKGIVRPDGTTVSQNYFTDGGNHFAEWGAKAITRIMHPWIAYQI